MILPVRMRRSTCPCWRVPVGDVQQRRIGVIAERQAVDNPWIDYRWRVTAVLESAPEVPAWTCLEKSASVHRFYAGAANLLLFPRETDTLKYNIEGAAPAVYVFLRHAAGDAAVGDDLDAPVERVAGKDVPLPYAANLEKLALPQVQDIVDAVKRICAPVV